MELRHLRYFVAVAEELHFGRAALRLRMAQPPLSQQIRKLEAELRVSLLYRTKRRVELTDSGRAFLDEAKAILLHAERAAQAAQRSKRGEVGRLAVGFAPWADFSILPRILRAYCARYPGVHVQVSELSTPDQIAALRDDRIQVGFLRLPVDERTLAIERVFTEPLVVVFPEGHRLEAMGRVPVATLADERHVFVPRQRTPMYHDLVTSFCRDRGFTLRITHEADHPQHVLSLVAAGLGVSLVPASSVAVKRPGLRHRPLDPSGPRVELAVAWRRREEPPALRAFLDIVRAQARAIRRPQGARRPTH